MCINVACSADITVSQPLLNFLQAHPVGIKQASAAMAQVVETDAFHLVRCQKNRKMLREIIRVHTFSHRIYIDIVEIVRAIAFAADLPVKLLLLFIFLSICSQAGLGAFLEGEMFQQIQVPASSVPAGAEFGIYVRGDSMEPRYHSGQIVWVKRCEELECGDIGIFVYDDCGYLKKYDEHTPDKSQAEFFTDNYGVVHNQPVLVSLNTKYSPILISPEQRFEVIGKVLN